MIPLDLILDTLGEGCLTTSALATRLDVPQSDVLAACKAHARAGKLDLVSHGWDFTLAWASPDAFLAAPASPDERSAPWYMTRRDRYYELAVV